MTRRFAVGVNNLAPDKARELRGYFHEIGSWWNWIPNFWLVIVHDDEVSCRTIRDKIGEISPGIRNIVVEVKGEDDWSGFGPSGAEKNMFKWIKGIWTSGFE